MPKSSSAFSIQDIKGIGPQKARLLSTLGIRTIRDALLYLPFRYEDRSALTSISDLQAGSVETVSGTIIAANMVRHKGRNFSIFEIVLFDGRGYLKVKWFNQPFLQRQVIVGQTVIVSGMVRRNSYDMPPIEMDNPEYEIVSDGEDALVHTNRVVPVYRLTEGISQKQFRKIMFSIVQEQAIAIQDPVPAEIISMHNLPPLAESIRELHFPGDAHDIIELNSGRSRYHMRLAFDELFLFELGLAVLKKRACREEGISFRSEGKLRNAFLRLLSFELTAAQKRVMDEISRDMTSPHAMNRLLQGDVGCGKTVVALAAMLDAVEAGYQAALMAPTEILAEQHYLTIHRLIDKLGLKLLLLSGGSKKHDEHGASDHADIVIGTHALIQEAVKFRKLGFAVIDEQHKFGVMQRALLRKKGINPDVLVMTATPIPRSLALTLYGDLDCSVINELPPHRKPIETKWFASNRRDEIFAVLKQEIGKGKQVYVVYPAIEESEKMSLKSATEGKAAFEQKFPEYRIGLLHGRLRTEEREEVMDLFKKKKIDILVSTTVIEVGVDVPDATVMLIVHAERFGLSQLHQLRGRVGRGSDSAYCILVAYHPVSNDAQRRLDIMVQTNDGFRIAEEDLAIRGPGEFLGTRQAGLPDLRNADIVRDAAMLATAKQEAFGLIEKTPELKEFPFLKEHLDVFWKGRVDLFKTG